MSGPFGSSQWMYNAGSDYEIANSLRMNNPDSAHLARSISTASNRRTFTISLWAKRAGLYNSLQLMGARSGSSFSLFYFSNHRFLFYSNDSNGEFQAATNALHRDTSAWYHVVCAVDTTQGTQSNRVKIYVNGVQQSLSDNNYPENFDTYINSTLEQQIGRQSTGADHYDGYLAEMHFVDGAALAPTAFGEFGTYDEWKPIDCKDDLTYGTHGFYLDFASSGVGTASSSTVGADRSGNDNHWTSTNVAATDQMIDTPTNNFATMSPIDKEANTTLSEGSLKVRSAATGASNDVRGTMQLHGKVYYEVIVGAVGGDIGTNFGFCSNLDRIDALVAASRNGFYYNGSDMRKFVDGSVTVISTGNAAVAGDVIGLAIDMDDGEFSIFRNNTALLEDQAFTNTYNMSPLAQVYRNDGTDTGWVFNFGQDSSFAGAKTAQGNTDGNGEGDFFYEPPSGYLALCTNNLPEPAVVPREHFNTVLWTGNAADGSGAQTQAVSGVGFQPDFVWIKQRSHAAKNHLTDSVRGVRQRIVSGTNEVEGDMGAGNGLYQFASDGFTVGAFAYGTNDTGKTYVGWNWKAGSGNTAFSESGNNPAGTHNANVAAGFSIVSYVGTGAAGTVSHGLSAAPEWILVKNRDATDDWAVYYGDNTNYLELNTSDQEADSATYWNDTSPTASVFTVNTAHNVNADGENYIAYCFHSVEGFSRIGTYTPNNSTAGLFNYTGFRPQFLISTGASFAASWAITDNKREPGNPFGEEVLFPNQSNAETNYSGGGLDFVSNGFNIRSTGTNGTHNGNGTTGTFIYMAFAEAPFKYGNAG
jgi:hypothetical protein